MALNLRCQWDNQRLHVYEQIKGHIGSIKRILPFTYFDFIFFTLRIWVHGTASKIYLNFFKLGIHIYEYLAP